MRITIESTTKTVTVDGVPARIWEGHTESGIPVHCFVTRIAAPIGGNLREFEQDLQEHRAPSADVQAYSLRLLL